MVIGLALHWFTRQGIIRRLVRSVYDFPRCTRFWNPSRRLPKWWSRRLVGRGRTRLQPVGAYVANTLGLTEQVPAKMVFLTDCPPKTVNVGPMSIQLRRTTPNNMEAAGRLSGLLIQALRQLDLEHITWERREHLKHTLPLEKRRELLKDLWLAPTWMQPIFRELAEETA